MVTINILNWFYTISLNLYLAVKVDFFILGPFAIFRERFNKDVTNWVGLLISEGGNCYIKSVVERNLGRTEIAKHWNWRGLQPGVETGSEGCWCERITSCMNFLQTGRISLLRVALNIITCFSWGVIRNISWTSFLISVNKYKNILVWIYWGKQGGGGGCQKLYFDKLVNKVLFL